MLHELFTKITSINKFIKKVHEVDMLIQIRQYILKELLLGLSFVVMAYLFAIEVMITFFFVKLI